MPKPGPYQFDKPSCQCQIRASINYHPHANHHSLPLSQPPPCQPLPFTTIIAAILAQPVLLSGIFQQCHHGTLQSRNPSWERHQNISNLMGEAPKSRNPIWERHQNIPNLRGKAPNPEIQLGRGIKTCQICGGRPRNPEIELGRGIKAYQI